MARTLHAWAIKWRGKNLVCNIWYRPPCILTGWVSKGMVQNNVYNHWRLFTLDAQMRRQSCSRSRISKGYSKPWHLFEVFIKAVLCTVWTHKNDFKRLALFFYFVVGIFQLWCKASARWALQKKKNTWSPSQCQNYRKNITCFKQKKKVQSRIYPGELITRTGDREIRSVSGRLPDNPGELA